MAKKSTKSPTADDFVKAINAAINSVPGVRDLPETVYCEEVGGALDSILSGINMRQDEVEDDDEEND